MVITIRQGDSKKNILKILEQISKKSTKGIDIKKFVGKVKIQKNPLQIQKNLRDEWN